jgi:hypothetical protein
MSLYSSHFKNTSTVEPQNTSTVEPQNTSTVEPQNTSTVEPQNTSTVEPQNKGHFGDNINLADLFFVERFSSLGGSKHIIGIILGP